MGFTNDHEREKYIDACNQKAPFSCLATGLGSNRRGEETRQQEIGRHSGEAIDEIMAEVEKVNVEDGSPKHICEKVKLDIHDILEQRMPEIIERTMMRLRDSRSTSMLDEPTLGYTQDNEIKLFLRNLGVDLDNQADLVYAKRIFSEALLRLNSFLLNEEKPNERILIPGLHPNIVKKLNEWNDKRGAFKKDELEKKEMEFVDEELVRMMKKDDILGFFKIAAGEGPKQKGLARQSCALLRIAYAIDYIERDPQISLLEEALEILRKQMDKHIIDKRVGGKQIWKYNLGENSLPMSLAKVELRTKSREGIISKLLHKPGNRTVKVLDHIGLRITTKSAIDTLKLIYYMFFNVNTQMFPYMSIRIDETKNLILDANMIEEIIDDDERAQELVTALSRETINHEELEDVLANKDDVDNSNQFSSPSYKSIHIVVDMPMNSKKVGRRASFPVEIQILDIDSMVVNEQRAPHSEYKSGQEQAVLRRIVHSNTIEDLVNGNGKSKGSTFSQKSLKLKPQET